MASSGVLKGHGIKTSRDFMTLPLQLEKGYGLKFRT